MSYKIGTLGREAFRVVVERRLPAAAGEAVERCLVCEAVASSADSAGNAVRSWVLMGVKR